MIRGFLIVWCNYDRLFFKFTDRTDKIDNSDSLFILFFKTFKTKAGVAVFFGNQVHF